VQELLTVRKMLSSILDDKFARECDTNYDLINPVVSEGACQGAKKLTI